MLNTIAIILYLALFTNVLFCSPLWNYQEKSDSTWNAISKFCGGRRQSPIKLSVAESEKDSLLGQYVFRQPPHNASNSFSVKNDGHKVKISFQNYYMNISLSATSQTCYRPIEIHFHWGDHNTKGSEHWMDNQRYPMEAHIVTWNCQFYNSYEEAANKIHGLSVFAIFYQVDPSVSTFTGPLSNLSSIINQIQRCDECATNASAYNKTHMEEFQVKELLPSNTNNVYVYTGSLTTPDCRENVLWNVFATPIKIPQSVMNLFRTLEYPKVNNTISKMVNNFREPRLLNPIYPLGPKRILSRSFDNTLQSKVTSSSTALQFSGFLSVTATVVLFYGVL